MKISKKQKKAFKKITKVKFPKYAYEEIGIGMKNDYTAFIKVSKKGNLIIDINHRLGGYPSKYKINKEGVEL